MTQVVRNHFNCQSLTGARLENRPTSTDSCTGSHWDERLFLSELMGPIFSGYTDALSPLTLAILEDSGWYKVSYENAELSPFGHGFGCDFVHEPCIVNDEVPDYARDAFCTMPLTFSSTGDLDARWSLCAIRRTSHLLVAAWLISPTHRLELGQNIPADAIRYFSDPNLVSLYEQVDFCPIANLDLRLDCTNNDENTDFQFYQGESRGPSSRCVNGNLGDTMRPGCFDITCDAEQHKVIIAGQTCEFDGQILNIRTINDQQATLECPRLGTICPQLFCRGECSGRGVCDYESTPPRCNCFDSDDETEACSMGLPATRTPTPSPTLAPSLRQLRNLHCTYTVDSRAHADNSSTDIGTYSGTYTLRHLHRRLPSPRRQLLNLNRHRHLLRHLHFATAPTPSTPEPTQTTPQPTPAPAQAPTSAPTRHLHRQLPNLHRQLSEPTMQPTTEIRRFRPTPPPAPSGTALGPPTGTILKRMPLSPPAPSPPLGPPTGTSFGPPKGTIMKRIPISPPPP